MQTKMLVKKPEPDSGRTNNPVNNIHKNKPAENKKKVRTIDYKKLLQMMLNDPDAITREEFLFLQSIIGYRQAVAAREKAKLRKQQRKIEQINVAMKPSLSGRSNSEIGKDSDGKKEDTSSKDNSTKPPIQMKKDDGDTSTSSSRMQHNLIAGLEKLSGVDLSDIKVHQNSDKPQQVGALAYTQGSDIHIAPGQEKHLPHEGWHVVQQKQGRVTPTMQMKTGSLVNDNAGLEKEADVMGAKAERVGSTESIVQLKKLPNMQQESKVIQRITQEEAMRLSKQNTHTQGKTSNDDIKPSALGEKSQNVKKIQQVLISMNYWTGSSSDKATGYFGDVTKDSLIAFQTGYLKLNKEDLYTKDGNYVGCGPTTAKSLNNLYKLLNSSNVPEQAKNGIMGAGKSPQRNSTYNWQITAGEYNGYVKEAQEKLAALGYKLSKHGLDGKWSSGGETYNALKKFQNACKTIYDIVSKYGGDKSRKHVWHFQGIQPTGSLDKATYAALQEQLNRKLRGPKVVVAAVGGNVPGKVGKSASYQESVSDRMLQELDEASGTGDIENNYNVWEEYGTIHKEVQAKASGKYGLEIEYKVEGGGLNPGKTDGWADLVDKKTQEVWEVKNDNPKWNEESGVGRKQLERYILASKKYGTFRLVRGNPRIKVDSFKATVFGKPATVTVRSGFGTVNDLENGMIYYKVKYDKDKDKKPKDVPIVSEKDNKNNKNKPKQNNNVTKFPAPEQKDDQQIAAAWWEKPAGIGLIIICTVATVALVADDVTGIGAANDPAIGATVSGIAKGAQMVFGW